MTTSTIQPKIAIIGAGPSGLLLARILHISGISATIYEGDASSNSRSQGGTLDLHPRTGQAALAAGKLLDQFKASCRFDGQDLTLADRHGKRYIEIKDKDTGRPEIDRAVLRQILLQSIPEGTIKWGMHLDSASLDPVTGKGSLKFRCGQAIQDIDLIVGADGAWSKIRPLLTPVQPFYSGISGVEITHRDIDTDHPKVGQLVGRGSLFAFGEEEGRVLLAQRQGNGSVRTYAMGWKPETWLKTTSLGKGNAAADRKALLEEYEDWDPALKEIVGTCDDDIVPRALYMLPPGLRWASKNGAVVVGDAAHVFTPFAGEGVNLALTDAMKLAENIIVSLDNLEHAVSEFEKWMFPFAKEMADETWGNLLDRFQKNGTQKMADHIKGRMAQRDKMISAAKALEAMKPNA